VAIGSHYFRSTLLLLCLLLLLQTRAVVDLCLRPSREAALADPVRRLVVLPYLEVAQPVRVCAIKKKKKKKKKNASVRAHKNI
jgi:hypothetical protein